MKLTEAQSSLLKFAARVCDSPDFGHVIDGVSPRRGQFQMFERLRLLGLLECVGTGASEDNHEREGALYVITEAGRAALKVPA